jgi:hypothetical protein
MNRAQFSRQESTDSRTNTIIRATAAAAAGHERDESVVGAT